MTEKITREEIEALLELADAATPGPWDTDDIESEDGNGKYKSYIVGCGPPDKWKAIVDTSNSDVAEIHAEYDEDGASVWDEVGRKNAAFIAAANPAVLKALCTLALQALDMEPRPIEEAPKDGSEILLYGRNWHCVAKWIKWAEQWRDATSCNYELKGAIAWLPLTSLPEPK